MVAIPDQYLEDNTINLWNWARPKLAEAIAVRLDETVLFGGAGSSRLTFPVGGVTAAAYSGTVNPAGARDAVDAVNQAMSAVEAQGLNVTGHSADIGVKGAVPGGPRPDRRAPARHRAGRQQPAADALRSADHLQPVRAATLADFFTGAWEYLVIGVRQDIRFRIDPSGVILGATTADSVSGFQDNVTPMKVWAQIRLHDRQAGDPPRACRGDPVRQGPAVANRPARRSARQPPARPRSDAPPGRSRRPTRPGAPRSDDSGQLVGAVGAAARAARGRRAALRRGRGHRGGVVGRAIRTCAPRSSGSRYAAHAAPGARGRAGLDRRAVSQLRAGYAGRGPGRGARPRGVAPVVHQRRVGAAGGGAAGPAPRPASRGSR